MTDYQYELKQLRNQLFKLSEQFDELYASYESLEVLIIDGEALHCRAVLNTLNYRFRDNLGALQVLYKKRDASGVRGRCLLRLVSGAGSEERPTAPDTNA